MREVDIDFFFPDPDVTGEFAGIHLLLAQEIGYPLTDRPGSLPMFFFSHLNARIKKLAKK